MQPKIKNLSVLGLELCVQFERRRVVNNDVGLGWVGQKNWEFQ